MLNAVCKKSMFLRGRVPLICHEGMMLVWILSLNLHIQVLCLHVRHPHLQLQYPQTVLSLCPHGFLWWDALLYDLIHVKLPATGFCKMMLYKSIDAFCISDLVKHSACGLWCVSLVLLTLCVTYQRALLCLFFHVYVVLSGPRGCC